MAQATVADHFCEFYLTDSSAFAAEQRGNAVALAWRTASEKSSARFEVERSVAGVVFTKIGQVAAQGSKATAASFTFRAA